LETLSDADESVTIEQETFQQLCGLAEGRTGVMPAEMLATHIMDITAGGDWPIRRAAMMAVLARFGFAKRDGLRVARRPANPNGLGTYETRRQRSKARPYRTHVSSVAPMRVSCDCPDFVRNSLGLCKHALVAVADIMRRPRTLERALEAGVQNGIARLSWNPIRPLTGTGDWLERVAFHPTARAGRAPVVESRARRWFRCIDDDVHCLTKVFADNHSKRHELVCDLLDLACHQKKSKDDRWDPALIRLLEREKGLLDRQKMQRLTPRQIKAYLGTLKRKLYPYQTTGVQRALEVGRLLLADDMGLGKTIQAIACGHVWYRAGRVQRGLIVVPASLKSQWLREWQLFTDTPARIVEGTPAERQAIYRQQRQGFLIANYEQVLRDLDLMHEWSPDLVVLDEAQRIKNWATKTAGYIKKLEPAYRLVLTGTPMENRLDELHSILEWVDPFALEPAWRLGPWHTAWVDGCHEAGGARHLDTLRARLKPSLVRRIRQEVLKQLPARTDTRVPVVLTPEQHQAHDDLSQTIARLIQVSKKRPLTHAEFLRLMSLLTMQRLICNGIALFEFEEVWPAISRTSRPNDAVLARLASPKLVELRELLGNLAVEQQRKVIVFSQWRRMLQLAHWAVSDLLARASVRAVFFSGQESQKRRTHNIVDFHDDPKTRVMFATDAGGVGLNLQRAASCCINVELPWNPAVLEQRIGRIYRLGQKHPIEVYNLVSEEGIESRICDLVGNKKALFTGLFDGTSDQVDFARAGSFLARVESVIEPPPALAASSQEPDLDEDVDADDELLDELASTSTGVDRHAGELVPTATGVGEDDGELAPTSTGVDEHTGESLAPELPAAMSVSDVGADTRAGYAATAGTPLASQVADLFAKVRIQADEDGSVTLKAPPEAASTLASVLHGMARMLEASASPEA
jgi:superfamily II DNA or RNA helicase